jgi:glycosyltransferase involved in cell wall biosynthesis
MIIVSQYGAFHGRQGAEAAFQIGELQKFVTTHPMYCQVPHSKITSLYPLLELPQRLLSKIGRSLHLPLLAQRQSSIDKIGKSVFAFLAAGSINEQTSIFHSFSAFQDRSWDRCDNLGVRKLIDWGIAHPAYLNEMLSEECQRLKVAKYEVSDTDRITEELDRADRILIPSNFVESTFISKGFSKEKLLCNPYGVSLELFQPRPRGRKVAAPLRVAMTGELSVRKGVIYLLDAVRLLKRRGVPVELFLFGEWEHGLKPLSQSYSDCITMQAGVAHHILSSHYSKMDVFVLPSLAEGMARVVLEAMACGLPCIVTTNTGYAETIRNGENGFVVPIRNAVAIADFIQVLYENHDLWQNISANALICARSNTWDMYKQRLQTLYREL